jgi:6-phosphogluconolactonase
MFAAPEISVLKDDGSAWADAAGFVRGLRRQAVEQRGRFLFALSGGRTPEQLYNQLTAASLATPSEWASTHFFFSDERCVPPGNPESNFNLAAQTLFHPLAIAEDHVHRMKGEDLDPDAAAMEYEQRLRTVTAPADAWPSLDLVLLGVGNDGHTASLFPGTDALREQRRWVTVGRAPSGPPDRLTLTLGVINQSTVVLFLASGETKAAIVNTILEPRQEPDRQLPAALVRPERGRLIWLLDRPAASKLTGHYQEQVPRFV